MKIKETSKAKNSQYSPWNGNDPELWMWRKTALKQLSKLLPTSERLERAIFLDNVSERGGYIRQQGEVIEADWNDQKDKTPHIEKFKAKQEEQKQQLSNILSHE